MRLSDFPTAATYFDRASAFFNDADSLVKIAEARWRAGQIDVAREVIARVLEKTPQHPGAMSLSRRMK
jgi:hypothetical protein